MSVKRRIGLIGITFIGGLGLLALLLGSGRFTAAIAAQPPTSQPPQSMLLAGHFGGQAEAVFVRDDYAYLGLGYEFAILNISNPGQPQRVSALLFPAPIQELTVVGNHAYLAVGGGGVYVVNITDPAQPAITGSVSTFGFSRDVAVVNNVAYLADDYNGLVLIDVSNPAFPTILGSYGLTYGAKGVAVSGNNAYVAAGTSGLWVINISNPAVPTLAGYRNTPGFAKDVALSGTFAYIADGESSGLQVVDISNPTNPTISGSLNTSGEAERLFVSGSTVYMSDGLAGLQMIDVSLPSAPVQIGAYETVSRVKDTFVSDGVAYIVDERDGLILVDPAMLPTPIFLGHYQNIAFASGGIKIRDHYLYVGSEAQLAVLDISTPQLPSMVSSLVLSGTVQEMFLKNDLAYVPLGGAGLAVVDISDPLSPTLTGWVDTPGFASEVVVVGNLAFVADFSGDLRIINVSQPASPVEVANFQTDGDVYGVKVRNNFAYLADGSNGLRIVDVGNLNNLHEIGYVLTTNSTRSVFLAGNYAYFADGSGGVRIVNISNPFAPSEVGSVSLFGYAVKVAVLGQYAYVSAENGGLRVVDVSDVTAPFETAEFNTPAITLDTVLDDRGFAYLADLNGGVYVATADLFIAGRVIDHNGIGFDGVDLAGTAGRTAVSDISGTYTMTGFLPNLTYQLTPTLPGYAFWPPNRSLLLLDSTAGQDFIILAEPVSTVVATDTQTLLSYDDVRGYQTDFDFPAGAVSETTAVTVTPVFLGGQGAVAFAGHGFDITAEQSGGPLSTFDQPVDITIAYSDLDIHYVTAENQLSLLWWDGSGWIDAAQTCSPTSVYTRNTANNTISLGVCRDGRYGLFGPTSRAYMPIIRNP